MKAIQLLEIGIRKWNFYLFVAGGAILLAVMLISDIDIVARVFRKSLLGATELAAAFIAVMVYLCWGHVQSQKKHISLDLIFPRLPPRAQAATTMFTSLLGLFVTLILTWQAISFTVDSYLLSEINDSLRFPLYTLKIFMFIGALGITSQFTLDLMYNFRKMRAYKH